MEELNFEKMETTQGGKFWGSEEGCHDCDATGYKFCWKTSYMFWMNVGTEYHYEQC